MANIAQIIQEIMENSEKDKKQEIIKAAKGDAKGYQKWIPGNYYHGISGKRND